MYNNANTFAEIKETREGKDIWIEGDTYSDVTDYDFEEYNYKLRTKQ